MASEVINQVRLKFDKVSKRFNDGQNAFPIWKANS
jgi:hypothetical protein